MEQSSYRLQVTHHKITDASCAETIDTGILIPEKDIQKAILATAEAARRLNVGIFSQERIHLVTTYLMTQHAEAIHNAVKSAEYNTTYRPGTWVVGRSLLLIKIYTMLRCHKDQVSYPFV